MKVVIGLAFCLVVVTAKQVNLNDFGYYWRDWNTKDSIPVDAVPGGVTKSSEATFIAKTVYPKVGVIVPGEATDESNKMWFEFDNAQHFSEQDVQILCSLNPNRLKWISTRTNELVSNVVKDKELVIAGHDRPKPVAIGRFKLGSVVHIGKVIIDHVRNTFMDMRISADGKGWGVRDGESFEVLVYDKNQPDCLNLNVSLDECLDF